MTSAIGVVLAGGASRRFGRDKAEVLIGGETLAARAVRRLRGVCDEVLVADRGRGLVPGALSIDDGPGSGPASGLLGAAAARPGRSLLALACDLPAVPVSLLEALTKLAEGGRGHASRVPRHGASTDPLLEPLCALYRPEELEVLSRRVADGELSLHGWLEDPRSSVRFLEGEDLLRHGDPEEVFVNLNRPRDLDRWRAAGLSPSAGDGVEDVGQ